jgi:chromodomain-helicase-DNA-binding protein 7
MFDVDPKWAELVKEMGNLPNELAKRVLPGSAASPVSSGAGGSLYSASVSTAMAGTSGVSTNTKKSSSNRPSTALSNPPTSDANSSASLAAAMGLPFGNHSLAALSGLNPSLLSSLGLGGFDKNPLLLPFAAAAGSMPGMGGLAGLSSLGGLGNSLFANLASLGFGLDGSDLTGMGGGSTPTPPPANSSSSKSKSRSSSSTVNKEKTQPSSSQVPPTSSPSSIPTSSLPFFFPNPSLLYTPLGLGGLNPFAAGGSAGSLSSAYDSLAQQCQLLNGMATTASSMPSRSSPATVTSKSHRSSSQSSSTSANHKHHRGSSGSGGRSDSLEKQQLQRLLLQQQLDAASELARSNAAVTAAAKEVSRAAAASKVSDMLDPTAFLETEFTEGPAPIPSTSRKSRHTGSKQRSRGGSITKLEETVSKLVERKSLRSSGLVPSSREGSVEKEPSLAVAEKSQAERTESPPPLQNDLVQPSPSAEPEATPTDELEDSATNEPDKETA